jgi:hypothetical protein
MKTYLTLLFNSEGSSPSEVKAQLMNLGFKVAKGGYDFVYEWNDKKVTLDELVWFADKVHTTLQKHKVFFTIETI